MYLIPSQFFGKAPLVLHAALLPGPPCMLLYLCYYRAYLARYGSYVERKHERPRAFLHCLLSAKVQYRKLPVVLPDKNFMHDARKSRSTRRFNVVEPASRCCAACCWLLSRSTGRLVSDGLGRGIVRPLIHDLAFWPREKRAVVRGHSCRPAVRCCQSAAYSTVQYSTVQQRTVIFILDLCDLIYKRADMAESGLHPHATARRSWSSCALRHTKETL